jgi:hypothetical protein
MDRWTAEGKVRLDDDLMQLPALNRSFKLSPAVYFQAMVDGADAHNLLGRVKSQEQLQELGAEHYGASVILGEVGYECVEGFLGHPADDDGMRGSGLLKLGS